MQAQRWAQVLSVREFLLVLWMLFWVLVVAAHRTSLRVGWVVICEMVLVI